MPLESLLTLAETLKERISTHGETIGAYEIRTRCALIDPLLSKLGWDVSNPAVVIPEYVLESTKRKERADYALLKADGTPAMLVEAKSLGTNLDADVLRQVLNYAWGENVSHFAVTDGAQWEIYATSSPEPIVAFDLSKDPLAEACLKALALWRPSLESGSVTQGQASVIEPVPRIVIPTPPPLPPGDWRPLTDMGNLKWRKPAELLFPDNNQTELKNWVDVLLETARWLSRKGQLVKTNCSIKNSPNAKRYIVHTSPIHSNGNEFKQPREVNGFWVEGDTNVGAPSLIGNAKVVIEHVGQDPSQFRVRFRD